jgi:hypothetical protein
MVTGSNADALPTPNSRANIRPLTSRPPTGPNMTARIPENVSTLLVDWNIVTIMGNTMPPRHPNDDDDDDDDAEDEDGEPDEDLEPAVVREPDE